MGECHYQVGNYDAMVTAAFARKILAKSGISTDRLALEWASAAEAPRFVRLVTDFTNKIKELGPLGEAEHLDADELRLKLSAARRALEEAKLRTGFGKLTKAFRKEGDYSEQTIGDKLDQKVANTVVTEIGRHETLLRIQKEGPISLSDLTQKVGLSPSEIEKYVSAFSKKGLVTEVNGQWSVTR